MRRYIKGDESNIWNTLCNDSTRIILANAITLRDALLILIVYLIGTIMSLTIMLGEVYYFSRTLFRKRS